MLATDGVCPCDATNAAKAVIPDLPIEGLGRRCALKHRNVHRERPVATEQPAVTVFVLC